MVGSWTLWSFGWEACPSGQPPVSRATTVGVEGQGGEKVQTRNGCIPKEVSHNQTETLNKEQKKQFRKGRQE